MKKILTRESDFKEIEVEYDDKQYELAGKIHQSIFPEFEGEIVFEGNVLKHIDNRLSNEKDFVTPIIPSEDGKRFSIGYFPKHPDRKEVEINGPKYVISIEKKW